MKVLYFHQHFSTPAGAAGTRSYEMAQSLIAHGHSVTMVCGSYSGGVTGLSDPFSRGKRRGIVDGIDIVEYDLAYSNHDGLLKRSLTFMRFALRCVGLALNESYDVLFATSTPLTAAIPGIVARWLRYKPFVFEVRDLWPELPRQMGVIKSRVLLGLLSILEWTAYRSATRLIGLSPGIVAGIARRGIPEARIALIPNGCDLGIFSVNVAAWRPPGVQAEDLMAVFAGTHGVANGLEALLDVAAELKRRGRDDIKIVLIGQGKTKRQLEQRVEREGLSNVVFHAPVSKERLAGLMASTDVGLQVLANFPAFYYGTSPNKFFDYIAAGLPVINNYPGWLADMIQEVACGYAVPADAPALFADALIDSAENRDKLSLMGSNAAQLAYTRFDRRKLGAEFVSWLRQAVPT